MDAGGGLRNGPRRGEGTCAAEGDFFCFRAVGSAGESGGGGCGQGGDGGEDEGGEVHCECGLGFGGGVA